MESGSIHSMSQNKNSCSGSSNSSSTNKKIKSKGKSKEIIGSKKKQLIFKSNANLIEDNEESKQELKFSSEN
jgi:hypothetical protein